MNMGFQEQKSVMHQLSKRNKFGFSSDEDIAEEDKGGEQREELQKHYSMNVSDLDQVRIIQVTNQEINPSVGPPKPRFENNSQHNMK